MYLVITINIDVYVCLSLSLLPLGMDIQSPIQCETVHTIKIHFAHLRFYYLFNSVDCRFRWCSQSTVCTVHISHYLRVSWLSWVSFERLCGILLLFRCSFHERRNRRPFCGPFFQNKKPNQLLMTMTMMK